MSTSYLKKAILFQRGANLTLKGLGRLLFPGTGKIVEKLRTNTGKVIILRSGNIGDTACSLPALAAVRQNFPQAHISLLTSPGPKGWPEAGQVVEGLGLVDEVITFYLEDLKEISFKKRLMKELRRCHFDLFLLLPQERTTFSKLCRDLLFARLLLVQGAWGFILAHHFPLMNPGRLFGYQPPYNEVERLLVLLNQIGIKSFEKFKLALPDKCYQVADQLILPYQDNGSRPIIGLQTKAKETANQWPLDKFRELGNRLESAYHPLFILFGGPGERPDLINFADSFAGEKLIAAGKTSVLETAALLSRCHCLITLDTGPMHLAALVGTPLVALFSARQFRKMWEPHSDHATVLRKSVPCELCGRKSCEHLSCMKAIQIMEVLEAVHRHLTTRGLDNALPTKTV